MDGVGDIIITDVEDSDLCDWQLPLAFMKKRHTEKIEGSKTETQTWRMKERMKTVSVALVMCLNVGVDPPDVVKTSPCAKLECWIDPLSTSPQKALEAIGNNLQKQYERWQPRARYKLCLDPTVEEVKKLCTSLRRNAKEERVLFHYNGHGVPRPTTNGEIWVFNKTFTQYIPLSVYDLQTWMGSPSIFVYDCSNAGLILESFEQFALQKEQEREVKLATINSHTLSSSQPPIPPPAKNCIQLASCGPNEQLPMNPELPADLFTACLSTPIKIALRWFCFQKSSELVPGVTVELVDKLPGRLNDRRTPLGELNWIFTAVTDTIAWNVLPRELFQKLFRQDLLVASLYRNFLLAERIMRTFNCSPVSSPRLPPTYQHSMWQAWDLALDVCLAQLPGLLQGEEYVHSPFFAEQLTAFQVWLTMGSEKRDPPEQLPIVLQVLLSQVHRLRALDLLGRFLDLGPWAVSLALSVGIFPYVLKLLQSSARELRPLLVFIWAKILAVDRSCKADLVKDNGHKYFLSVLADPYMPAEHRTMAAFVLAMIVEDYPNGQEAALQGNVIAICLEQLNDPHPLLRQWLALCLARVWTMFDAARWCGVRDSAHEKLYKLLSDPLPEVRASAVIALGTFIGNGTERTDHAINIDHNVGMTLINVVQDGSPIVREQLVVALYQLIKQFESQFASVARQILEEDQRSDENQAPLGVGVTTGGWLLVHDSLGANAAQGHAASMRRMSLQQGSAASSSRRTNQHLPHSTSAGNLQMYAQQLARSPSSSSSSSSTNGPTTSSGSGDAYPVNGPVLFDKARRLSPGVNNLFSSSYNNVYAQIWKTMLTLASDSLPAVKRLAQQLVNQINLKATVMAKPQHVLQENRRTPSSAPNSPSTRNHSASPQNLSDSPPPAVLNIPIEIVKPVPIRAGEQPPPARPQNPAPIGSQFPHSQQFTRVRKLFDKGPSITYEDMESVNISTKDLNLSTNFSNWCCKYFAQSVMRAPEEMDPYSSLHQEREWRFLRNAVARKEAREQQQRAVMSRLDDQIFINRNQGIPVALRFQHFSPHVIVADKEGVCVWNWENGEKLNYFSHLNHKDTKITSMDIMNAHDISLLMTGCDDGAVQIWRNYLPDSSGPVELVSSWHALSDMLPSIKGAGLVLDWEQESGMLLASGDVRTIRVWDTQRELKLQDIPTGADSCVTSLACDSVGRSLLIAGCGDGSVRLYDRRLAPTESRVMTLREHNSWVVNVHLQKGAGDGKIISASVNGDVRFWDPRFTESVKLIQTNFSLLTTMAVHQQANIFACGSANQLISVFNMSGDTLSNIKYYEGFIGQRIGPVSCLAFHPLKVYLASGSRDSFLSIYSTEKKAR
ncbi:regulatory-associated protein of mTOR-like isoform X1 [Acanthaster planci]|uniref:Regulatory-associated protein of mTOR-like isoform X1 n=1 Tax=Acanthaster planci TaxID=133434 RepID=A0A8B7YI79_ACAPL|nr:regulatory-associated protein of mTOR-like isoform X1 [Acanthaster planci]